MINVTTKNSSIKGSQDPNCPFINPHPNKNIANKNVKPKETVNHKNSIRICRDNFCIFIVYDLIKIVTKSR